jgi:hypothetical protein
VRRRRRSPLRGPGRAAPDGIAVADRCVAIRDGRLAHDGTPDPAVLGEIFDRSELEGGA